jgi:hypothetical protein
MSVTTHAARAGLDLNEHEAVRREDEQIHLVDAALVVDELEVRSCPPRLVIG